MGDTMLFPWPQCPYHGVDMSRLQQPGFKCDLWVCPQCNSAEEGGTVTRREGTE